MSSSSKTTPEVTAATLEPEASIASPRPQKKRTAPALTHATAAMVTPTSPLKRRRLDLVSAIDQVLATTEVPIVAAAAAAAATTPSYADLYGEVEERRRPMTANRIPIILPNLHAVHPRRRNSVTKFSLQATASSHMTVLEAARKTIEKLRQEGAFAPSPSRRNNNGNEVAQADVRSILETALRH